MGSNTKILILKAKELIYTMIFVALGILLLLLLLLMFLPERSEQTTPEITETSTYIPGVYTSTVQLGDSALEVQVTVDSDRICDVSITNLTDTVTTMYPLLTPALEEINQQLTEINSPDEITYSTDSQYTSVILSQAIQHALEQAVPDSE